MKKQQIVLEMLSKLKYLNNDNLEKVTKAVDACLVVQSLSNKESNTDKFLK